MTPPNSPGPAVVAAIDQDDAIRVFAREAVLRVLHDHLGWPKPHMADDDQLSLAETIARAAIEAYQSRLASLDHLRAAQKGEGR